MAIEMTVPVKRSLLECIDRNPVWNLCWKWYQSETWSDTFPWQGGCIHHFVGDANGIKIRDLPFLRIGRDFHNYSSIDLLSFKAIIHTCWSNTRFVIWPTSQKPNELCKKIFQWKLSFSIINMDKCLLNMTTKTLTTMITMNKSR